MDPRLELTGISDNELVRRVVFSIRPSKYRPLWVKVMDAFALGSTYSQKLCLRYGLNPDATNVAERNLPEPPRQNGE